MSLGLGADWGRGSAAADVSAAVFTGAISVAVAVAIAALADSDRLAKKGLPCWVDVERDGRWERR